MVSPLTGVIVRMEDFFKHIERCNIKFVLFSILVECKFVKFLCTFYRIFGLQKKVVSL